MATAALAALGLCAGRPARANGRYPLANQLVVDPGDPTRLVARTTFGLLESADAGASWTWICEGALGALEPAEDPAIAVTAAGNILVASSQGLSVSSDGCTWIVPAGGQSVQRFAVDLAVDPQRPAEAVAVEVVPGAGAYDTYLVSTADDGASWADLGAPLAGFLATTVEIAPSDSLRVYVTGQVMASQANELARSDDGGRTFTRVPIAAIPPGASAYIGAVDPADADVVYLRVSPTASTGGRVLVSRDGGATFDVLWTLAADASGFALSPDGATLAVGGSIDGLYVGGSDGTLQPTAVLRVSCLTWSGAGILACADEPVDGFEIGVSADLGVTFAPLLHLASLAPRACPGSPTDALCRSAWPSIASSIGADAGTGGGGGGAGDGGCGCGLGGTASSGSPGLAAVGATCGAFVVLGRRRSRARRRRRG